MSDLNDKSDLEAELQKRLDDYKGPAVLRPDLIYAESLRVSLATGLRALRLERALRSALIAIDALIDNKPALAANMCGSTTLGNVRAEIKAVLDERSE